MSAEKCIYDMTRAEFWELPERAWSEDVGQFDSLVILPTRRKHDSGFRCMDFVACRRDQPICRLSGCSDVLHVDGIGGYGHSWLRNGLPTSLPPKGWSIDCLGKSGLLRLFTNTDTALVSGPALSSFEVFGVVVKGEQKEEAWAQKN